MFSSVFLIGLSAAGRPLTSYLSPAWEAIGTFTYYPLKAWCWWGEWTSSWKIPAHLHISYLWLKSASLPLRVERCCLFYILKKKKSRGWNLTVGLSDNPHFHSAVTPPCHSAYITLGGLNASWWELILNSPALKTFFFLFSWKSSLSGSQQFDFSFNSGGLTASEMLCLCHYWGKGMKRSDLIYQSLSDKDGFAIKEANDKKLEVPDTGS